MLTIIRFKICKEKLTRKTHLCRKKKRFLTTSMHLTEIRETPHIPQSYCVRHASQDKLHGIVPRWSAILFHCRIWKIERWPPNPLGTGSLLQNSIKYIILLAGHVNGLYFRQASKTLIWWSAAIWCLQVWVYSNERGLLLERRVAFIIGRRKCVFNDSKVIF